MYLPHIRREGWIVHAQGFQRGDYNRRAIEYHNLKKRMQNWPPESNENWVSWVGQMNSSPLYPPQMPEMLWERDADTATVQGRNTNSTFSLFKLLSKINPVAFPCYRAFYFTGLYFSAIFSRARVLICFKKKSLEISPVSPLFRGPPAWNFLLLMGLPGTACDVFIPNLFY